MKRYFVIASHGKLAAGMQHTLEFISGSHDNVQIMTAYTDNQPIEEQVKTIMGSFNDEDEVIIVTDLLAGSVNQKFFPYHQRKHTHIFTGMNLPLIMALIMENDADYLPAERARAILAEARAQLAYVNDINVEADDDDE
ncbi:PTS sugar transporter subunit IIA [Lactiplantibacillus argentoratensis]|uniref:PTS sugar transporter subunit IIA n=1 Tax=Lactiplantibacillus argentoratensis TaxID=271881 RepID=UPI001B32E1E1|nr:PTS N-acetylglucosamine transporter subunit IIBC [Lactiplantibacillus argentoratensis]MBP5808798.1 PTS N-acetylglucosamine transporter subunit IIBC [Lactiplantibacillus argentoratensis]